jgi:hypothetical protein
MKRWVFPLVLLLSSFKVGNTDSTEVVQQESAYEFNVVDEQYLPENLLLDELPSLPYLFAVAEQYLGRFAVFFLALKIEESGTDTKPSWLVKNHNNLTGMRYPRSRQTYAIGSTNTNYAIYRNWFESMLDFKIYIQNMEERFVKRKGRPFADEYEMLNAFYSHYNIFDKWYKDMRFLIPYVKKKYANPVAEDEHLEPKT